MTNDRFKFRFWNGKKMIYDDLPQMELYTDYVIMQSTGIRDKNGKLIYEGDIIDLKTRCKWVVTWFRNRFILVPDSEYGDKDKFASDRKSGYAYFENNNRYASERDEVVGNIYEDRRLLNG